MVKLDGPSLLTRMRMRRRYAVWDTGVQDGTQMLEDVVISDIREADVVGITLYVTCVQGWSYHRWVDRYYDDE